MDFLLLPIHRGETPTEVRTTPYRCLERYDLGPWLSYPDRKGKSINSWNGMTFDQTEYLRSERVKDAPTSSEELEPFLQEWAFFGLLAEFSGINSKASGDDSVVSKESQTLLDEMYETMLIQDKEGKTIVTLCWDYLSSCREMMVQRLPKDPTAQKERYEHLHTCLTYAHSLLKNVPEDFNYAIKYSICALGEFLMQTVRFELEKFSVLSTPGRIWGRGFLDEENKRSMVKSGWCPSDISRADAKYTSLQSLHICRMVDKSLPKRDHTQCDDLSCKL